MTRLAIVTAIIAAVFALSPGVVHADAAAPSDYRTTVVSVSPEIPGLAVAYALGPANPFAQGLSRAADLLCHGADGCPL